MTKHLRVLKKKSCRFMFFQEVHSHHNCSKFGNEIMSLSLLVEAMKTHFIPLVVYNNKGESVSGVLNKYNKPRGNNTVIRIVNSKGKLRC